MKSGKAEKRESRKAENEDAVMEYGDQVAFIIAR